MPDPDAPLAVRTRRYALSCLADRPYVALEIAGERLAELYAPSSVHGTRARDDTVSLGAWRRYQQGGEVVLELAVGSSLWAEKVCRFRCGEEGFRYEVEVAGEAALAEVCYFGGYLSALPRWGSGFLVSQQAFAAAFCPEPTTAERPVFPAAESGLIDLAGVPLAGRDGWFFTPAPYLYAFRHGGGWLGLGVEAAPGENRYGDYRYHGQHGAFHLSLDFGGYAQVSGRHALPALRFVFAETPYGAVARHAEALRRAGLAPAPSAPGPEWWLEPIFCGWGAQCALARRVGGRAPEHATQANYERFVAELEAHGAAPGTLVIDDKWQAAYGTNAADAEKWPDLPGFVAAQHRAGRRVLLWLKAWDPEGVPPQECVRNAAGLPVAVDPTNPAFEARFRASVRRMLTEYGADGFKLDFTARIPNGPGLRLHGEGWGLELLRRYLAILHGEAKAAKPDALVMTHTPHPYLGDVTDMIRLNDINTAHEVIPAMRHRARVAKAALPGHPIDTDNWPLPDLAAWRAYLEVQPELGIPSLYYAGRLDGSGEMMAEADWARLRETWRAYRARLAGAAAEGAR